MYLDFLAVEIEPGGEVVQLAKAVGLGELACLTTFGSFVFSKFNIRFLEEEFDNSNFGDSQGLLNSNLLLLFLEITLLRYLQKNSIFFG